MPSAGFEPAIPAIKRLQIYALGRMATGIGINRGADKSLARPGRKQANVSVRMA